MQWQWLWQWLCLSMMLAMMLVIPAAQANSKASKTVLVYQTIGQPPGYTSSFKVNTAGLGYTSKWGLAYGVANAKEPNPVGTGITQLPVIPALDSLGNPLPQDSLLLSANQLILPLAQPLATRISGYMATVGAASGIFNYQQQVMVQGNSQPMYLVWQMITDTNGRPRFGNVQLIPSVPNLIYADYIPQTVAAPLPAVFASYAANALAGATTNGVMLPPPGDLQWYQINTQLQPQTGATTINLGGAFDAPTVNPSATVATPGCQLNNGQTSCDPDYGLKCLINHASDRNCPTAPINGYTDFITLENQQGASAGYLDYVRSLTPVYTYSTNAQGQTVQTATVTVNVTNRTIVIPPSPPSPPSPPPPPPPPQLPPTYTNIGASSYTVKSVVDRYYVTPDGNYVLVGEITTQPLVPQQPYDKTVTLPMGANPASYANIVIDPFNTYQLYDYTNDTVNGLPITSYNVAPVVTQ